MSAAPDQASGRYSSLDASKVIATIAALYSRINERFAGAGLARVCSELLLVAKHNATRAEEIGRANVPLRIGIGVVVVVAIGLLGWIGGLLWALRHDADNVFSLLQGIEAAANLLILSWAAVFFLTRIEQRLKRRQALAALHEMRSIIHVIDMHQLTKDPSAMSISATPSSPERRLNSNETARYLDYCSEMLSLSAKVAVLFAQGLRDTIVIDAVSDIERLTSGLSQKIWQKIMILQVEELDQSMPVGRQP